MNTVKVVFLLAALSGILMIVGAVAAGRIGVVIAFVLSAVMNFGGYWYSDSMVLKMYKAQPVTEAQAPGLHKTVRNLAARDGLPIPRLYIIPGDTPNAFATGRDENHAAVAVTEGILRTLGPEELEGVLGHELSHIKNKDILIGTLAATMSGAVTMVASVAKWAALFGGGQDNEGGMLGTIAVAVIAPVAATMVQMMISRSREYLADEGGAKMTGHPEALAGALKKLADAAHRKPMAANPSTAHLFIVSPLNTGAVRNLFSTHPPPEKRIERLMAMKNNRTLPVLD